MNDRFRSGSLSYLLPVILYCAFIFFISSLPSPPAPSYGWKFSDKINHTGAYGILMLLSFRASRWLFRDRSLMQQLLIALVFTMLYGVSDEIHQSFVPNRECELYDWLADTLGRQTELDEYRPHIGSCRYNRRQLLIAVPTSSWHHSEPRQAS